MSSISCNKKNKYEQFVKLYKSDVTDKNILANKLKVSVKTISKYISRAIKEGLIAKPKNSKSDEKRETYNKLVELYNLGFTDLNYLSQHLKIDPATVKSYIRLAIKEGKIVADFIPKREYPSKYDEFLKLYNSDDITDKNILANKLHVSTSTIYNYINKAIKAGKINVSTKATEDYIISTPIDSPSDLSIDGQSNEELNSKPTTPSSVTTSLNTHTTPDYAYSQDTGELSSSNSDFNLYVANTRISTDVPNNSHKSITLMPPKLSLSEKEAINNALKKLYPTQAAKYLNIPVKTIYDYIDTLPDKKRISLKTSILKNNSVWKAIRSAQEKAKEGNRSISVSQALDEIYFSLKDFQQIDLVHLYFWISNSKGQAYAIANKIANSPFYSSDIRKQANMELPILKEEVLVTGILKDIRERLEKYGVMTSYNYLSEHHNVTISFLVSLLGREELDR